MSEEKGWAEAIANASELAKLVYPELLQPASKEIGSTLGDIAKTGHLLLFPFQLAAVGQDRIRGWLDRLRTVPEEQRITPAPEIAGPVLTNLPFTTEGQILETMYLNLLNRAMDKSRVDQAHPAFTYIISQFSPDEALLLMILRDQPKYGLRELEPSKPGQIKFTVMDQLQVKMDDEVLQQLRFPKHVKMYFQRLLTLNVLEWREAQDFRFGPPPTQKTLRQTHFSDFGELFVRACVPEKIPPDAT